MGRVTKAVAKADVEALSKLRVGDPVPGNNGKAMERIVAYFKAEHPEAWEELRLQPLQHGLVNMAELLK